MVDEAAAAKGWEFFCPGILTPGQFADLNHGKAEPSPGVKLFAAILENAICDLSSRNPERRIEAKRWVKGWPAGITFAMVCTALRIDVSYLRRALLRLADRQAGPRLRRCRFDVPRPMKVVTRERESNSAVSVLSSEPRSGLANTVWRPLSQARTDSVIGTFMGWRQHPREKVR